MWLGLRSAVSRKGRAGGAGMTLVELLIAAAVAGVALAAAWPLLWNVTASARKVTGQAQAGSEAARVARVIGRELRLATGLEPVPAGTSPGAALNIRSAQTPSGDDSTLIAWDPARRVLWRDASGSYVADDVRAFTVEHFDAHGDVLAESIMQTEDGARRAARVRLSMTLADGRGQDDIVVDFPVGPR